MDNKLKTVTIGIPAYNEQRNIAALVVSILKQKASCYKLEKVYIASDGSTDGTAREVRKLQLENKIIKLIDDKKRIGQAGRLNQFFKFSDSDVLITFDADTVLADDNVIENIISCFNAREVGLVGGNDVPFPPNNLIEKIGFVWIRVWYEVRANLNNGITVHNHHNTISALAKQFYKNVSIPRDIISNDDFLYFSALLLGLEFRFAREAKVFYKLPSNFREFFLQTARLISLKHRVARYFGDWVYIYYDVPLNLKFKAVFKVFVEEPLVLPMAVMLQVFLRIFKKEFAENYKEGHWTIIKSTK